MNQHKEQTHHGGLTDGGQARQDAGDQRQSGGDMPRAGDIGERQVKRQEGRHHLSREISV